MNELEKEYQRIKLYLMAEKGFELLGPIFAETLAAVQIDREFQELCQ